MADDPDSFRVMYLKIHGKIDSGNGNGNRINVTAVKITERSICRKVHEKTSGPAAGIDQTAGSAGLSDRQMCQKLINDV